MHAQTFHIQLPPGASGVTFVLTPQGQGGYTIAFQPVVGVQAAPVQRPRLSQVRRAYLRGNEHLLFSSH